MSLVPLVSPESEADLMTTVALLEGHGIPTFVRGGGMGGLYPGLQIASYNTRTILVPEEQLADAMALLSDVEQNPVVDDEPSQPPPPNPSVGRMILEALLFGWFVPGSRSKR